MIIPKTPAKRPLFPKAGSALTPLALASPASAKLPKHTFSAALEQGRNPGLLPVVQARAAQTLQTCLVKTAFINYANTYFPQEKPKSLISCRIITIPWRNQELITMQPNQADIAAFFKHKHSVEKKQFSHADYVNTTRFWSQSTINHVRMV